MSEKQNNNTDIKRLNYSISFLVSLGLLVSIFIILPRYSCLESSGAAVTETSENLNDKNIADFTNYLPQADLLNWLRLRERLMFLSVPELTKILDKVRFNGNAKVLSKAIEQIILDKKKEDLYVLKYDCLIGNKPQQLDMPSYNGLFQGLTISAIKPYAENLYFYNLNLKYGINSLLLNKGDGLWNPAVILKHKNGSLKDCYLSLERVSDFPLNILITKKMLSWSYNLKSDNFIPFFLLRQWIKEYEENQIRPVIYQNAVIVRNEYRIFCLDLASGNELWSFGNVDNTYREYYLTAFHLHCNSHGYRILLAGNIVYADLGGNIVALDLKNILKPVLIWKRPLGEYGLCTSPVAVNGKLIAGLVNSKGELWMCGFNCQNGELAWSTYIGTSTYQSPSSPISLISNGKLFIATNYGVLVCLYPDKGELLWIKKYMPKNNYIFDFWRILEKKYDRADPVMSYDTQFLEAGDDQVLYFKARESNILYILDQETGQTEDKISIETKEFYLLGVCKGRAVFLGNNEDSKGEVWVKVISVGHSKEVYSFNIKAGPLRGVISGDSSLVFKVGKTVYHLKILDKTVVHEKSADLDDGWLLGLGSSIIFTGEERTLSCWVDYVKKKDLQENKDISAYLTGIKKIKSDFTTLLDFNDKVRNTTEAMQKLLFEMKEFRPPIKEIFPVISGNVEKMKEPAWDMIIKWLRDYYGEEIINYRDIDIKFTNFLYGTSLLTLNKINNEKTHNTNTIYTGKIQKSDFRGDPIYLLPPINIINGNKLPDFYLLIRNDQLVCVQENGNILWTRKICWGCFIEEIHDRFGSSFPIELYLFDNILIINDFSNIIAVNMKDGSYVWSMGNLSGGKIFTHFIGSDLVIINGNKLYSVSPNTGVCNKYKQLDINAVEAVGFSEGGIYILPASLDSIKLVDNNLMLTGELHLNFTVKRPEDGQTDIFLIKDHIVLDFKPIVYMVDAQSGSLRHKIDLKNDKRYCIETRGDQLLIIFPFKGINICRFKGGIFKENSILLNGAENGITSPVITKENARYYFFDGDSILLPFQRGGSLFIGAIDIKSEKKLYELSLNRISGPIAYFAAIKDSMGQINFIISALYCGNKEEQKALTNQTKGPVDSKLFCLDILRGSCIESKKFPSIDFDGLRMINILETNNCFIYGLYGNLIEVVPKDESHD